MRIGGSGRGPTAYAASARIVTVGRRLAIATLVIAGVAMWALHLQEGSPFTALTSRVATSEQIVAVTFSICGAGRRTDCVIDGDTFWVRGEIIRIADIDAPELSPPRCQRKADIGEAAKRRLHTLLNAGPVTLAAGARDQDQYGRKLRTVSRDGRSIGDMLIAEGLARRWNGPRQSWCE